MMRSFGSRQDTACVDEPFYAAYLTAANLVHPMQEEILAAQSSDPSEVAKNLSTANCPAPVQYQKQMTHHFLEDFPTDWMQDIDHHVFLIRHPARVISSYSRKMDAVSLEAIGFPQLARIFDLVKHIKRTPPIVVDSDDILENPATLMSLLCKRLGIDWDRSMLAWTPGPKPEDGAWAPHWYDTVYKSTGFGPSPGPLPGVARPHKSILDQALPIYQALRTNRLKG